MGNAAIAYVLYLWQMIYPARLAVFYPHPWHDVPVPSVVLAVLLIAAICAAVLVWVGAGLGRRWAGSGTWACLCR